MTILSAFISWVQPGCPRNCEPKSPCIRDSDHEACLDEDLSTSCDRCFIKFTEDQWAYVVSDWLLRAHGVFTSFSFRGLSTTRLSRLLVRNSRAPLVYAINALLEKCPYNNQEYKCVREHLRGCNTCQQLDEGYDKEINKAPAGSSASSRNPNGKPPSPSSGTTSSPRKA